MPALLHGRAEPAPGQVGRRPAAGQVLAVKPGGDLVDGHDLFIPATRTFVRPALDACHAWLGVHGWRLSPGLRAAFRASAGSARAGPALPLAAVPASTSLIGSGKSCCQGWGAGTDWCWTGPGSPAAAVKGRPAVRKRGGVQGGSWARGG